MKQPMNPTNFTFLRNDWPQFYDRAVKAEKLAVSDPRSSLVYSRMALELAVNWMYKNDAELELPYDAGLNSLMKTLEFKNQFGHKFYNEIDLIRKVGNLAVHNKPISGTDSGNIIIHLFYFAKWFAKCYAKGEMEIPGLFDPALIPKVGEAALTKRQLAAVQENFDKELVKYQEELKKSLERNKELEEENVLFR